jgi:hypothetical protein
VAIARNFVIAFRRQHSHIRAFPKAGCSETGYDIHIGEYRPMTKKEISSLKIGYIIINCLGEYAK